MVFRSVAALFVVLIVVPFTAPFSTCEVSVLLASSPPVRTFHATISRDGRSVSMESTDVAQAAAPVLQEEKFKRPLLIDVTIVEAPDVRVVLAGRIVTGASGIRTPLIALRV